MKLKLQLFANKKATSSIRRDDVEDLVLKNDGTVAKPQKLIQDANAVNTPITYTAKAGTPPKGVSEEDWNTMHSTFTESGGTTALGNEKNNAYGNLKNVASNTNIIDQKTKDALNATFVKPSVVLQAESYLFDTLAKIQSGRTSYTDQVESMMNKIMNREEFEYDVDSDQLFQQALASAMNSGKSAMQDTIGQASALTGGYGSTYATSAGNQAYNAFIEDAYNNLPEYYQMALNAYQMEGEEMYKQLGMLSDADAREYGRMVDAYNATSQFRNQAYNEAYTLHQDGINNAYNSANLQLNENAQLVNNANNIYNAASNEYEKSYAKDFDEWNAMVQQSATNAGFANSDWWNQTNFDYQKEWNQTNFDYQKEWNQTNLDYQKERDAVLDSRWEREFAETQKVNNAQISKLYSSSSGGTDGKGWSLTPTEAEKVQEVHKNAGGGDKGDNAVLTYLATIGKSPQTEEDVEILTGLLSDVVIKADDDKKSDDDSPIRRSVAVSGFGTNEGNNFTIKIDDESYSMEHGGPIQEQSVKDKLDGLGLKNGQVLVNDGKMYLKKDGSYYKLRAGKNIFGVEKSGYSDLMSALLSDED